MDQPKRVSVAEVRRRLQSGEPVLLVCAYPGEAMFRPAPLEGAISYPEFQRRLPALDKRAQIVFY